MTTYTAHEILGGLYENTVKMTVDRRLRYAPYSQAGWRERKLGARESALEMYSYSSRIFTAKFDDTGVAEISTRDADAAINYSRTTSRQVSAAMQEIGLADNVIARLKKWFTRDPKHVTAVYIGRGDWMDAATGEVIA